jgi:capsular exopolysaccharide synthesis family protein
MSRIQNILDKAERDGGLVRLRSLDNEPPAAHLDGLEHAPLPPDISVAPPLMPGRTLQNTRLDPLLVTALAPDAAASEQYRALRLRVAHTDHDHGTPVNVILVTSPGRREGKTLTAANLALTMAQDFQRRICVVDADLRHSRLHRMFGLGDGPGLAEVLTGRSTLGDALTLIEDQQVTLLPAGRPTAHPAELLGGAAMRDTIHQLRSTFDRVIIDAPPTSPLADAGILAPLADGVVLVVRAGLTTKPAIQEAVASIGSDHLLGIILNDSGVN